MWLLPNQDWAQANITYPDLFLYILVWNISLFSMGLLAFFLFTVLLKYYFIRRNRILQTKRQSLLTYQQSARESQNLANESQQTIVVDSYPTTIGFKILSFLNSLSFYLFLMSLSVIYLAFFAFQKVGKSIGFDVLAAVVMVSIVLVPTIIWKERTRIGKFKELKKQIIFTIFMVTLWMGFSVYSVLATKGICLCVFNENYGIRIQQDFYISSSFYRSQKIQKICPDDEVCHVYATVPEDIESSVFINIHTGLNLDQIIVVLKSPAGKIYQYEDHYSVTLDQTESINQRIVHTFLYKNLEPNTNHELAVINTQNDLNITLKVSNYRTPHNKDASEIKMVIGGDVGLTHNASLLTQYIKSFDPDIIFIGGDIAYDDGMRTCYYSWDNFYAIFEELDLIMNRTVPFILSVGNHDVGYQALADVSIQTQGLYETPLFLLYNPQHYRSADSKTIPPFNQRQSSHYHLLGNMVHLHLDSGYLKTYEQQQSLITSVSEAFPKYYKFANYHNPIYPSCTDSSPTSNDVDVIAHGTKYWTPLFDKYNYVAGFQHHTHHRKITKKLKNDSVDTSDTGTRYVGDGSWGVPVSPCSSSSLSPRPQLFLDTQKGQNPNHFWELTLTKDQNGTYSLKYAAINSEGQQIYQITDKLPKL